MTPPIPSRIGMTLAVAALWLAAGPVVAQKAGQDRRPSLSLKVAPAVAFSPARVVFVAELRGGANDYEEYYCPGVEWEWGDGTTSENSEDCDPYEDGRSEIRRRWTVEHVYRTSGTYRVYFRLERHDKVLGAANVTVQIRPGVRDPGGVGLAPRVE